MTYSEWRDTPEGVKALRFDNLNDQYHLELRLSQAYRAGQQSLDSDAINQLNKTVNNLHQKIATIKYQNAVLKEQRHSQY